MCAAPLLTLERSDGRRSRGRKALAKEDLSLEQEDGSRQDLVVFLDHRDGAASGVEVDRAEYYAGVSSAPKSSQFRTEVCRGT